MDPGIRGFCFRRSPGHFPCSLLPGGVFSVSSAAAAEASHAKAARRAAIGVKAVVGRYDIYIASLLVYGEGLNAFIGFVYDYRSVRNEEGGVRMDAVVSRRDDKASSCQGNVSG